MLVGGFVKESHLLVELGLLLLLMIVVEFIEDFDKQIANFATIHQDNHDVNKIVNHTENKELMNLNSLLTDNDPIDEIDFRA